MTRFLQYFRPIFGLLGRKTQWLPSLNLTPQQGMNIDKDNFEGLVETVKKGIEEAEFVAIDLELSGISKSTQPSIQSYVNAQDYYDLHKEISSTFQILQVGICTFKHTSGEGTEKKYACMPYNFYIFPEFHGKRGEDNVIRFSADAVQFLRNYKFDFNRAFYKGVPYMKKDEEEKATEFWESYFAKQRDVELKEDDVSFIAKLIDRVGDGVAKLEGTENTLTLGKFVEFDWRQRKLIYQEIPKRYSKIIVEKKQIDGHDSLIAKYDSAALSGFDKKKKEIQGWVGFRHIMDYIAKSGKPIVGHNCFLDVLFMTQSFATDLKTKSFPEFKQIVLDTFPVVYDTKHVINALVPTMRETGLEKVHLFITNGEFDKLYPNKVTCTLDPSVAYTHAAHEAGYDAYMTGVVFAKQKSVATQELLDKVGNCVYLLGCEQSPMTLTRSEEPVDLSKIFLVTNFPASFTNDTFQEEARFGTAIRVKWVNDTTCLVMLLGGDQDGKGEVTARVKLLKDWEVVALHELELAESGPSTKKMKV